MVFWGLGVACRLLDAQPQTPHPSTAAHNSHSIPQQAGKAPARYPVCALYYTGVLMSLILFSVLLVSSLCLMQAYGRWTIPRSLPLQLSSQTHSHAHGPMFSSHRERVAATTCMGASLQLLSRLGWSSISSPRLLRSRCHMLQQLEVVVHSQPTY